MPKLKRGDVVSINNTNTTWFPRYRNVIGTVHGRLPNGAYKIFLDSEHLVYRFHRRHLTLLTKEDNPEMFI